MIPSFSQVKRAELVERHDEIKDDKKAREEPRWMWRRRCARRDGWEEGKDKDRGIEIQLVEEIKFCTYRLIQSGLPEDELHRQVKGIGFINPGTGTKTRSSS